MPKRPRAEGRKLVAVAFRVRADLKRRIEETAEALGLDASNLLRLLIAEGLPAYAAKARALRGPLDGPTPRK